MNKYLNSTFYFDSEHPDIQSFVQKITKGKTSQKEKAIALYKAVRDGWPYNPSNLYHEKKDFKGSQIFSRTKGHCLDKSILMITCCRAAGIPARLALAKVKNHIAAEKMIEKLGTDELVLHGYVEVFLDGKWIKNTPVFNDTLCRFLNVATLEFDGKNDSVFQEFDKEGGVFMEYLEDYGNFADVPFDLIFDLMRQHYPHFFEEFMPK